MSSIRTRIVSRTRLVLVAGLSAVMVLGAGMPASAAVVVAERGSVGAYQITDSVDQPGARCRYSRANASGDAFLRWVVARPPEVFARDVTSGRDRQRISWTLVVQRSNGSGPWRNVAAVRVGGRAWDDQAAELPRLKLFVRGREGFSYRAKGVIRWWRNRSVEGAAKYLIEYYAVRWTVGDPAHVFEGSCPGHAD